MSDHHIQTEGITVAKSIIDTDIATAAIGVRITSDREAPAAVRIVDRPPDEVSMTAIEFAGRSIEWEKEPDRILTLSTLVEPDEAVQTGYFITEMDGEITALPEPAIDQIDPIEGEDAALFQREGTRATSPAHAAETPQQPLDSQTDHDSSVESADSKTDPSEMTQRLASPDDLSTSNSDTDSPPQPSGSPSTTKPASAETMFDSAFDNADEEFEELRTLVEENHPISWGEVIATIVDELENKAADKEIVVQLRKQVVEGLLYELRHDESDNTLAAELRDELQAAPPDHLVVRLEAIETQLAELGSYTGALRDFIDEEGTASDVLETVHTEQAVLEETIDALSTEIEALRETQETVQSQLATVETDLERLDEISTQIDQIEDHLTEHETAIGETQSQLDELETELEQSSTQHDEQIATVQSKLTDLETAQQRIRDSFQTVAGELSETTDENQ